MDSRSRRSERIQNRRLDGDWVSGGLKMTIYQPKELIILAVSSENQFQAGL